MANNGNDKDRRMIAVSIDHKNKLKKLCINNNLIDMGSAVEYMIDQAIKGKIKIPKK